MGNFNRLLVGALVPIFLVTGSPPSYAEGLRHPPPTTTPAADHDDQGSAATPASVRSERSVPVGEAQDTRSDDHTWRMVVSDIAWVGASTGGLLTFFSFKSDHIDGLELGVGASLFVGSIVTMVVVLSGEHQVAVTPGVRASYAGPVLDRGTEAKLFSNEAPGLTLTTPW
jgi:hypothetical protein